MKYTTTGNLSLGVTSPDALLDINAGSSGKGLQIRCSNYDVSLALRNNATSYGYYWLYRGSGSGNSNNLELWTDGQSGTDVQVYEIRQDGNISFEQNVGIGQSLPAYELDVMGSARFFDGVYDHLVINMGLSYPTIQTDSRVNFRNLTNTDYIDIYCKNVVEMSDINSKINITAIESGLEVVRQLNGVRFNWKNDDIQRINAGLIAQEVEEIIPEVVFTNDSTGEKLISYTKIIPFLIEAIKDQQAEIDELKNQLEATQKAAEVQTSVFLPESIENASLFQNTPNPFNENTIIKYSIPRINSYALIIIYDLHGSQVLSYRISQAGNGEVIIPSSELNPGMFIYNLIVDDYEVDSKRMILTD